jgi:thiamine-phosphate pyrophosphorylase
VPQDGQKIALLRKICEVAAAGVDYIQIREQDLSTAELSELARQVVGSVPASCRLLINDRLDVACAVGAGGVHLGEKSISVSEAKRYVRERGISHDFLIGASVHSLETAQAAERGGADYAIFGPVFATPSKAVYGAPQGLEKLATVCRGISIPVFAVGGITPENAPECYAQGALGIAAIRVFQEVNDVPGTTARLRGS